MGKLETEYQHEKNVDERLVERLTSFEDKQHMIVEVLMEDTNHDDFDFKIWCMNARVVLGEGQSIDLFMRREEKQSLSVVIEVGRKTKDSQDEEYVPWVISAMEEKIKVDEPMCVDINEYVVIVDEVDEYLMGSFKALVLHEEMMLGEIEKEIVYICTPEQGSILGEDDSDEEDVG